MNDETDKGVQYYIYREMTGEKFKRRFPKLSKQLVKLTNEIRYMIRAKFYLTDSIISPLLDKHIKSNITILNMSNLRQPI